MDGLKIISGTANRPLAEKIAERMGLALCDVTLDRFADGQRRALGRFVNLDVRLYGRRLAQADLHTVLGDDAAVFRGGGIGSDLACRARLDLDG